MAKGKKLGEQEKLLIGAVVVGIAAVWFYGSVLGISIRAPVRFGAYGQRVMPSSRGGGAYQSAVAAGKSARLPTKEEVAARVEANKNGNDGNGATTDAEESDTTSYVGNGTYMPGVYHGIGEVF